MSKIKSKKQLLSDKSLSQLILNLEELKKELFNLRFQKTFGEFNNTSMFKKIKKNVARVSTEITARKNNEVINNA